MSAQRRSVRRAAVAKKHAETRRCADPCCQHEMVGSFAVIAEFCGGGRRCTCVPVEESNAKPKGGE